MRCSVFIATSLDGFIAKLDGNIDWLYNAGDANADMTGQEDMGFNAFIAQIDCIIMGRKTMQIIESFNLSDEEWPYGNLPIYVVTNTLDQAPKSIADKITLFNGTLDELMHECQQKGYQHAYIDGGQLINGFLQKGWIQQLTLTLAPTVLGTGIPLFHQQNHNRFRLSQVRAYSYPNQFVQLNYQVYY